MSELPHYVGIDAEKTQALAYDSILKAASRGSEILLAKAQRDGDDGKSKLWAELALDSNFVELLLQASEPFVTLLSSARREVFAGSSLAKVWHKSDKCEDCNKLYTRDLRIYGTLRTVTDPDDLATAELLVNKWFELWLEDTL